MQATILDGRGIAEQIKQELKEEIAQLRTQAGCAPGLAIIRVGEGPSAQIDADQQGAAAEAVGITPFLHHLPPHTPQAALLDLVGRLNHDERVHGMVISPPLPSTMDRGAIFEHLHPDKDVEGCHPINRGRLLGNCATLFPPIPAAILELLRRNAIELVGKRAVIVGSSDTLVEPTALMLLHHHATISLCPDQRSKALPHLMRQADLVVTATGVGGWVNAAMIQPGAVVIDVGLAQPDGRLEGEGKFGIGPLAAAMLLKNTAVAFRLQLRVRPAAQAGQGNLPHG